MEKLNFIKQDDDIVEKRAAIEALVYITLGVWGETAGGSWAAARRGPKARSAASQSQLDVMKNGVESIAVLGGVSIIWNALRDALETSW